MIPTTSRAVVLAAALLSLTLLFAGSDSLRADSVYLHDGRVYENVKTTPGRDGHFLIFEDGNTILVRERDISRIEIADVDWERPENGSPGDVPDEWLPAGGWSSAGRSAVVPGWGQWRNEHPVRGGVFLASLLLLGYQYLNEQKMWRSAQAELDSARNLAVASYANVSLTLPFSFYAADLGQQAQSRAEASARRLDWIALLAGAVYVWNLADAYFAPDTQDLPGFEDANDRGASFHLHTFSRNTAELSPARRKKELEDRGFFVEFEWRL